jgi:hypothetical protein
MGAIFQSNAVDQFNPLTFFHNTAAYASQGRGVFFIGNLPVIFQNELAAVPHLLSNGIAAKGFAVPAQQLGTYEPFSYNGPTTKHAWGQIFTDIDIEFLLIGSSSQEAQDMYRFFTRWQELIAGTDNTDYITSGSEYDGFSVSYYNDYFTNATAIIHSPSGTPIISVEFREIYPITIGPLQTSWESPDAPISFTVTFTFFYPVVTKLDNSTP